VRSAIALALTALALSCETASSEPASPRPESDLSPSAGQALGPPALLSDGSRVESRAGDEPGESDLVLVEKDGRERRLAPAPGPDDLPTALPDGRVVFVSGRTGLASLFVVDPKTDAVRQLTNRGLRRVGPDFVPPPARRIEISERTLRYDAARGERWEVEIETGRALRGAR